MNKITMCNYYGMCDSAGNVMGHTCKVTKEYLGLLSKRYAVSLLASPCIVMALRDKKFEAKTSLKYNILIDEPFTFKKRICDKLKLLKNLQECVQKSKTDILFFYQVDFFFFFYLAVLYRKRKKKVYCLIYHQDFTGGRMEKVLGWFYQKALKKVDGILYTQKGHPVKHINACWMPDYLYGEEQYLCYQRLEKQEKAVCLGTMNRYKCLEELTDIFSESGYPLLIIGRFDDTRRFEQLKQRGGKNIQIENRLLGQKEYYEILGSAKFSILPYDMKQYQNRTSGVLLESLYVGSIPVAPAGLLDQNKLPGIGYGDLKELASIDLKNVPADKSERERRLVLEEFGEGKAVEAFENVFQVK